MSECKTKISDQLVYFDMKDAVAEQLVAQLSLLARLKG